MHTGQAQESCGSAMPQLFLKNAILSSGTAMPESCGTATTFLFKESASGQLVSLLQPLIFGFITSAFGFVWLETEIVETETFQRNRIFRNRIENNSSNLVKNLFFFGAKVSDDKTETGFFFPLSFLFCFSLTHFFLIVQLSLVDATAAVADATNEQTRTK